MSNYPQLNNQDILALRKALTLLSGGIGAPAQIAGNALTPPPTTPVVPTGNDTGNEIPGEAIAIGATVAGLGMEYAGFGEKTVGTAHRPGFGLGNTTSLASAGSVLGPWGTAGGAALGLGLDVAKYMRGDKQFKKQVFSQNFHDWREVRNRDLSRQDFTYQMKKGGVVKMNTGGQVKDPYQGYHGLEGKKRLQQQLVSLGYDIGPTGVDGILGKNTGKAVKQLQKDNALNVDGISGPQTLALLRTAFEQPGATAASQPEQPASQPATVATAPIQAPENDYEASLNQLTEMYEGGAIDAEGFVNGMALLNKVTGVKTASTPVVSAAPKGPVVNDDGWDYYNPGEWELSDMDGIRAGGVDYRLTGPDGGYDAKETRFIKGGEKYEQPGANAFLSRFREELKDAQVRLKQVGTAKGRPMSVAQYMMNGDDRWQNMDSLIVAEGAGQFGNYDENGMYIPDSLTTRQRNINLMPTTKKMEGTDPYYFRKHGYKLVEGKPLDRNTTTAAEVYGKLRPKDAKARPDQPDQSDILKTTAIWGTSAASAGDPIRDFRDAAEYYKRTGKMLPEWGMQFSRILADNKGDVSKYRYIDTKFRKGGVARLVPVELEAKEIAIMPVGDSYIEILRTPHNIPKHENGGKVYHLPEGAEVFNRELMDRVDEAMKKKNWSEIRNNLVPARDKILEAAQLLGDPYSTGLTSDQAAMYGRKGCKVKGKKKKNYAMRTYRIGGVAGPGDPPVNEPLPRALGATAEVSAKGTKNYLPTLPDNFFAKNTCKEENCSEYTTTAIANITGQDRSNFDKTMAESAWFKRNKILKNGGIDVWNKERGTEINYDDLQVGDMVSLSNRSMAQPIDYSRDQDVRNGVKKEKYARHSGIIVGKNKDGIPIVEHNIHSKGDKGGTLYREPINDIKEKYTYEPLSVTRPKETINFDFADYKKKVIGSWNAQNTLTDKVSWKRPKVGDELYDAYINVREDLISGYRITAQQADKIFGELYGIAAQESNLMNDLPVESLRDLGSEIKQGIKVITPESVNKLAKVLKSNKSEEGFVPGWKREKAIVELIKGGMDESEAIAKVNEEMPKIKAPYTVTDKSRGYFKQKGISERAKKVFGFDDTGLLSRISLNEKRASRNPYSSTENQIKNAMGLYLENMGKAMEYYPDMDEETKYKVATLAHNTPSTAFNKEYIDFFIKGEGNPDTKKYNSSYINKARGYRDKYLQSYHTGGIIKAQNGTTVTDPPLSYRILGNQLRNNQALIKQLYAQQQLTPQEQMTGLEGMTPDQLALFKRNRAMTAGVGMVAGPTRADMPLQIPSRLPQQADQLGAVPQGLSVDTLQPGPTERYSLREQLSPYLPSFGKMGKINVTKPDIYSMNTILQSGLLANNLMQQAPDYIHLNKPAPTLMRYDSRPVTDMVNKGVDTINSIQRNYDQKGLGMQMMGASMGGAQILQLMNQGGAQQLQGKQAVDAQNAQILNQNDAMRAEVDNQEMNLNLQLQSQYQTMRDQAISKQANSIMQNEFARKQSNEEGQQQKIDNVVQLEALKYAISEGVADSPEWETYRDAKLQEVMTGISTELGDPMNPTNERYKEKLNELSTVYGALAPYSKQEELQRDLDELEKLKKSETSDAIAAAAEIETRITAMQQEKEKEKQAFLTSRLAPTMNNLMLGDMNQLRTERYNESELLKQYRRERGIPDADIATLLKTINSINR